MAVSVEGAICVLAQGGSLTGLNGSVGLQPGDLYDLRVKPSHVAGEDGHLEAWDTVC